MSMSSHAHSDVVPLPRGRHRNKALADYRRARAVELKVQGFTCQQIADQLNIANRGTVSRMINQTLAKREVEDVEFYRMVDGAQLDALLYALTPQIERGNIKAIMAAERIVMSHAKLFGFLPSAPSKTPSESWPCCQGPWTLVVRPDDCRHAGCSKHGKFDS